MRNQTTNRHFPHRNPDKITLSFYISFLEQPYDTNCFKYGNGGYNCYQSCIWESDDDLLHGLVDQLSIYNKCEKCKKQDCYTLKFTDSIGTSKFERMTLGYREIYFSVSAAASFTFKLFIQQIIGLVTIFFEFRCFFAFSGQELEKENFRLASLYFFIKLQ